MDDNEVEFLEPEFDNDNYQLLTHSFSGTLLQDPEMLHMNDDNMEVTGQQIFKTPSNLSQQEAINPVPMSALQRNETAVGLQTPQADSKPRRTSRFATKVCIILLDSFCLKYYFFNY